MLKLEWSCGKAIITKSRNTHRVTARGQLPGKQKVHCWQKTEDATELGRATGTIKDLGREKGVLYHNWVGQSYHLPGIHWIRERLGMPQHAGVKNHKPGYVCQSTERLSFIGRSIFQN